MQRKRKLKGNAKLTDAEWYAIEARYSSGESAPKIVKDYPEITVEAIHSRAKRNRWRTPEILRREADALLSQADNLDKKQMKAVIEKKWDERRQDHLAKMHKLADRLMDQAIENLEEGKLKVKSIHDLNLLDGVMRRTVGLDEVGKKDQAEQPVINIAMFKQISPAPQPSDDDPIDV